MAVVYLRRLPPSGNSQGAAAYHDKRFALLAALEHADTAIFIDADSRLGPVAPLGAFPPGLAVLTVVRRSIAEHLEACGPWRLPAFVDLARHLTGDDAVLQTARWCHETCYAVTRDGHEDRFFLAWDRAAQFMQSRGLQSGEGGVMGLAAACAGWTPDYQALESLGASIQHEGGGPKES
jgi:hypothetical protein